MATAKDTVKAVEIRPCLDLTKSPREVAFPRTNYFVCDRMKNFRRFVFRIQEINGGLFQHREIIRFVTDSVICNIH